MNIISKLSERQSTKEASAPLIKDILVPKDFQNGYTTTASYLENVKRQVEQDFYKALECPFLSGSF